MLMNAVVIVLRETLEAGVLVSVLMAIGRHAGLGHRWLAVAFALGVAGAAVYARYLAVVSEWFDYVGQEVVNASLQLGMYLCLLLVALLTVARRAVFHNDKTLRLLTVLLSLTVLLASVREGSEIMIFFVGFMADSESFLRALTSGFIGLMIGLSVGALCYYFLVSLPPRLASGTRLLLLTFLAAGMVAQAAQLLVQADWLPSTRPLWNTSGWLSESSVAGQLAYAAFGYEASPTPAEAGLYIGALLLIPVLLAGVVLYQCRTGRSPS